MTIANDSRSGGEARPRTVACPTCGARAVFAPDNEWRPFCSERCRLVDLGAWASEAYRVPERPSANEDSSENEAPKPSDG